MRRFFSVVVMLGVLLTLLVETTACNGKSDADVAARNVSVAAEQFEVNRRFVFINGITDTPLFALEGYCSIDPAGAGIRALAVICRYGDDEHHQFSKYYFGLSDNVTWTVEQLDPINVSTNRPRMIFKPEALIPDLDRP